MLALLIQTYFLRLLSGLRHSSLQKRLFSLLIGLTWLFLLYYLFQVSSGLFSFLLNVEMLGWRLVTAVLTTMLAGLMIILFISGVTIALHFYYVSSDFPLLLGIPISHQTLFRYKFFEIWASNSTLFWYGGLPIVLAFGAATQAHWSYYPLALLLALIFMIVPAAAAILVIIPLVKWVAPNRAREISGLVLALVIILVWASLQFFRPAVFDPNSAQFDPIRVAQIQQLTESNWYQLLPSSWLANILSALVQLQFSDTLLLMAIFILFAFLLASLTIQFMGLGYRQNLLGGEFFTTSWRLKVSPATASTQANPQVSSFVLTLVQRDLLLIRRDSRQLSQFVMNIVVMVVMPLIMRQNSGGEIDAFGFLPYWYFLFFVILSSILTGSKLIPLEGKAFWHILSSPLGKLQYLAGKYLTNFITIGLSTTISVLLLGWLQKIPAAVLLQLWLAGLATGMGATGLALVIGAAFPRFDWDHPRRMLSSGSGFVMVIFTIFYTLISVAGAGIIFRTLGNDHQPAALVAAGMLAYLFAFALAIAWVGFKYARHRLEKYDWHF